MLMGASLVLSPPLTRALFSLDSEVVAPLTGVFSEVLEVLFKDKFVKAVESCVGDTTEDVDVDCDSAPPAAVGPGFVIG